MGEIAEMMLEGTLCQVCGEFMDDAPGYPQTCAACGGHAGDIERPRASPAKVPCPICKKRVKQAGLYDHMRDVHPKRMAKDATSAKD